MVLLVQHAVIMGLMTSLTLRKVGLITLIMITFVMLIWAHLSILITLVTTPLPAVD